MSKNSSIRNRFNENVRTTKFMDNKYEKYKFYRPMPYGHFLGLLCLILIVFSLVIFIEKQLPLGLRIEDEHKYPDTFIAERAYTSLKKLTKIGPRQAGSYENEVLAVNMLKTEIESIIKESNHNHLIQMDIQKASGAFNLKFLDGMTNAYEDLQNVVVKIGSKINSPHSLLINCHFDSVVDSPGASDDGASCAVMLEILRVLSKSKKILRHNIIFLFNGGEENFLPASHGFITQHKWAKEIRAFINLDACGAGGREVLFQAGPYHPWILETYSEEVPYPYASSLAQEIFQSGIIPGDTDYRIFRDFGNLSGLDFAWSANGYVYHTKFDSVDYVPLGSLQRMGDNILALAKGMAQGHQLSDIKKFEGGKLVFFDFLGAFVVRWPMMIADVVNISSVIFSLYSIFGNFRSAKDTDGLSKKVYAKKLVGCMLVVFLTWVMSVVTTIGIAGLINCLGRTMSWYARPLWIFFLYVIPTLVISMATVLLHSRFYNKDLETSPWTVFQLYYDAYQLNWTLVLVISVVLQLRSSFIPFLWVFSAALGNVLKSVLFTKWRDARWLLLHISVFGLPFVQCFYLSIGALYLFIPIMGRAGSGSHGEFVMSFLVTSIFANLFSFVAPLGLLVRGVERIFSLLTGLFFLSLALLILTPLGFPYSGDPGALAPQRFMIAHTHRMFHDISGKIEKESSGFWIADMDINSPHTVDRHVPDMQNAQLVTKDCDDYLYCGLPYLVPVLTMIWKTHWLPGAKPTLLHPVTMNILNQTVIPGGQSIAFKIEGPNHIGVMISPASGVEFDSWSLPTEGPLPGPLWNGRNTYFIYYAYGLDPKPLLFSINFKIPKNHKGHLLDLAVTSHYLFGPGKVTKELKHLVGQFPTWTAVTHWTASYESWII